jgi:3-hydroxyisobutyrate dehydrogenase-like beta-hydroxyacid dehydrogenase
MNVGFIGVGEIGFPMISRLVDAGLVVTFYARRPEVIARTAALGAMAASSETAAATDADVVVVCVLSDDQVREMCLGENGVLASMSPGSVLVNHTTGSPRTAELLGAEAAKLGVLMLDAAFSVGPLDVAAGNLTLLVGGAAEALAKARPVLDAYGKRIFELGALGNGQRLKLVNNALFGAGVALVTEAERVVNELGLDPTAAFAAIAQCSGDSYALRGAITLGSAATLQDKAGRYIRKDVAMVMKVAEDLDVDLGMLGAAASFQPDF